MMKSFKTKKSLIKAVDSEENDDYEPKKFASLQKISIQPETSISIEGIFLFYLDFQILKVLGKGAFGKVYMARRK